ncbi:MAG: hypothetical protein K1X88_23380 [Nannocystaceae bacterium]|nr:hypothetical protein [Nannocystaceae bacterium]
MSRGGAARGRPGARAPKPAEQRQQALLDRIEDRLRDAPMGFHDTHPRASAAAIEAAALPPEEAVVWARWDGLGLGGEAELLPLSAIADATAAAQQAGVVRPGDRVIASWGRDLFVLPEDPWAEGAAVVRVEEAGDRSPESSSVAHLVLGILGELSVLYDEHGEFREDLFGDDGEPTPAVQRKLCRRRLDLDPDAPNARLRLAELLRGAGELAAAKAELGAVLKRAPEFAWAHQELGRTLAALGEGARAKASFCRAAECVPEPAQQAFHLAWAAWAAPAHERAALVAQVLAARPDFALQQASAASALLQRRRNDAAREQIELGLAIVPGHLELLRLRREADAPVEPDEPEDLGESEDLDEPEDLDESEDLDEPER